MIGLPLVFAGLAAIKFSAQASPVNNKPIRAFPIITVLLIAANILVYLGQQAMPGWTCAE